MIRILGAAGAAMALAVAPLQAACWRSEEASAANVRELQSALMVAMLRCSAAGRDFSADYNVFLRANRATIQQMNDRIKAHFVRSAGPARGQIAYDSFTTSLANNHGAEGSSAELCDDMDALAREGALMQGSAEGLMLLAAREGLNVRLPEGRCDEPAATVAMATPAR